MDEAILFEAGTRLPELNLFLVDDPHVIQFTLAGHRNFYSRQVFVWPV